MKKDIYRTLIFITLIFCLAFSNSLKAQFKGTVGNKFIAEERKSVYSVQLNAGYNFINNNNTDLFSDLKGFPLGFAVQYTKNEFWFLKFKYTNFAFSSLDKTSNLPWGDTYVPFHQTGSISDHLLSFTYGLLNSKKQSHRFEAGISLGIMLEMSNYNAEPINPYLSDDMKEYMKIDESATETDFYLGLDLGYKYFLTGNLFLGAEFDFGYLLDREQLAFSLNGVIGWQFLNKRNYRF